MDAWHVVLGVIAIAATAGVVALLAARGRAMAVLAAAEVERARSDDELARARADGTAQLAELRRVEGECQRLREELTRLNAEAAAAEARFAAERDAMAAQHRTELDSAERLHADRVRSLAEQRASLEKRIESLNAETETRFEALAAKALRASGESLLQLAEQRLGTERRAGASDLEQRKTAIETLLKPIAETLARTDQKLSQIEKDRAQTFGDLQAQLRSVSEAGARLTQETSKLVNALKRPDVRGRWGELQLRRVVELSGMRAYCDFAEQTSVAGIGSGDGRLLRPDMVVSMPGDRRIVIDAKTNINAYIESLESEGPDAREERLSRFADHVADQVTKLGAKNYWEQFDRAPEFVVMFIPGDQFIDAALTRRPDILEAAAAKRVILASPSTLIGLLRAVELGWREQKLAEAYDDLRADGATLHDRFRVAFEHVESLGSHLSKGVVAYNAFIASYQRKLEPSLKKFEDAGLRGAKPLPEVKQVEVTPTAGGRALLPGDSRALGLSPDGPMD